MFVSGPVGTSVTGRGLETSCSTMKSAAGWPIGRCVGGGSAGPSNPLSPCTWAATRISRTSGLAAPGGYRDVRAAGELEDPERVRRRLVERLVPVHRGDAEELQLGAGEREQSAIASS